MKEKFKTTFRGEEVTVELDMDIGEEGQVRLTTQFWDDTGFTFIPMAVTRIELADLCREAGKISRARTLRIAWIGAALVFSLVYILLSR